MVWKQLTLISVFYSLAESFVQSPQKFDADNMLSLELGSHISVRACTGVTNSVPASIIHGSNEKPKFCSIVSKLIGKLRIKHFILLLNSYLWVA